MGSTCSKFLLNFQVPKRYLFHAKIPVLILFLLLAYRCLLIDSYLSTLACRLLLADSCLPTLACRLLLVDPCLPTLSCLLLATNTKLSPCYRCLACYLLQMRQPSCLLTCCKVLLVIRATCCDFLLAFSFFLL
ncbi:hypothetical protein Tco_1074502 [Tanacetum coccineum]